MLPGGFSYGDYLRGGAIARFSPVVAEIVAAADDGLPVLGICNGFQVLCEAHLLPGALIRNAGLHFVCRDQRLRVESTATRWTGAVRRRRSRSSIPVKHGEGRYVADADDPRRARGATAGSSSATSAATPTAPSTTSPGSATRPATSSA